MRHFLWIGLALTALAGTARADSGPAADKAPRTIVHDSREPIVWHFGHGQPETTIVFMHGLGGSPIGHEELLADLLTPRWPAKGSVKVIAVWMRPERGVHTMTDQLARARAVIAETPGPVFLMGHSFGGKAALNLAQEFPKEKVSGLITLAPSVNMLHAYWKGITGERQLPAPATIERVLGDQEVQIVDALRQIPATDHSDEADDRRDMLRGALSYARTMRDLNRHDEPGTEANVTRPTLVFHGTDDESVSIHYARRFAAANPESVKLVELPDVGHGFKTSRSTNGAMAKEIRAFVQQNTPRTFVPTAQTAPTLGTFHPRFRN